MEMYPLRVLRDQPFRLVLTVGGIALCIMLMMFLLSVYRGVADGSLEYIRHNRADLWVLQQNATNILRGSSVLQSGDGRVIRDVPGVRSVSPVLLVLSIIRKDEQIATVFMAGYDPAAPLGGPPCLIAGRNVATDDEIVLDEAFAAKLDFTIGDGVYIHDDTLQVVGISTGTNAFVIQYAFVTHRRAQLLLGFPHIVTCFLVTTDTEIEIPAVATAIQDALPQVAAYDHETFLQDNTREMQAGFLPFIYTIAAMGIIVLTVILSLLLSINILEQRKTFAVLKTLGSPKGFLPRLIIMQALLISAGGTLCALVLFFPMISLVGFVAPEVAVKSSFAHLAAVVAIIGAISLLSSSIALQRLRRIYPLEIFS